MHTPERIADRLADLPRGLRLHRTPDLRRVGLSKRGVRAAMAFGMLTRVGAGRYLAAAAPDHVTTAAREGGRVACTSVLGPLGVFVLESQRLHLHFPRSASKFAPVQRSQVWHWMPLSRQPAPWALEVDILDALIQATVCQAPRAAIATLDSALHQGLIDEDDLDEIFARVPARRRVLRRFVDGRAESGPETLVRLMALMLGFDVDVQVVIRGIGRVDLVLDGWLAIECDSRQFHSGWESQKQDRRRDLALAAIGMVPLRPVAEDIMYHPERVVAALRGLREARRGATSVPFAG